MCGQDACKAGRTSHASQNAAILECVRLAYAMQVCMCMYLTVNLIHAIVTCTYGTNGCRTDCSTVLESSTVLKHAACMFVCTATCVWVPVPVHRVYAP